jgi:hypothetical protein
VKDFFVSGYSKVSQPDSGEIARAPTQITPEKEAKHTMPPKLKEHHTFAGLFF